MFLLFWNRLIQSIRNLHGTTWKIGSSIGIAVPRGYQQILGVLRGFCRRFQPRPS